MPDATRIYVLRLIEIAIKPITINNHYAHSRAELPIWVIVMTRT